ncbi:50S ribosomal protein L39e [Candidatus Nanohalovita haloferacivicina]|uniref:50S ribosomal protein L39e n=1 Tax=Candidatus Nanohalovita haloferacivicina TaxID=2978046 RepID=UPI00157D69E7|nr:50S ribosomal protein L39e [Candidatus Nanohaloarchaea archaeon]WEL23062.1 Ribosomal protein L39E [Candidatus Nanohalobia archaeon BNXNv]
MSSNKSLGKKKRLSKANKTAKSAPRWVSLKAFGMDRAMKRSIKPRKSRHWRRNDTDE